MITVHFQLRLEAPIAGTGLVFNKKVVTDHVYLQPDDAYEICPMWEHHISSVTWSSDLQSVMVRLVIPLDNPAEFARSATRLRAFYWIDSARNIVEPEPRTWTWGPVPIGTLVPGRGYITNKFPSTEIEGCTLVTFAPDEQSLMGDRYQLALPTNEEIRK